ncbi:MAG: ELM1/GtrOC1 family putative glycosyltransferase, partial [Thalassobaculaceae bacterium]
MSARPPAWILSDGTRGMEVQARALATALNLAITVKRYRPHPLLRACPALGLSGVIGPHAGGDDLAPPWPAVALACGRRNAGAALWLKKRGGVPVIQIQDPKSGNRHYDLLVVPTHDGTRGDNVITTTGSLNGVDDAVLATAAAGFAGEIARLPGPRVAVAIGGSNRRYRVT